ncbi:MAG: hypothetical protein LBJ45_00980 [Holosporaceae bacterium]|jgi:hypothetical protein|nr:hypothetical protein [Holosporaceae bacterium]
MVPLKNNALKNLSEEKLCETHNDKKSHQNKIKLSTRKAYNYTKVYHPLKNKEVRLHRLKFVKFFCYAGIHSKNDAFSPEPASRLRKMPRPHHKVVSPKKWSTEDDVLNWLASIGIEVKRGAGDSYVVRNKVYSINYIMVLANRKRIESGLEPFYVYGVTEF